MLLNTFLLYDALGLVDLTFISKPKSEGFQTATLKMASMGGKRTRDYMSVDLIYIHTPNFYMMSSVKEKGILMCDCCFDRFDTDKADETLFKYNYPGVSRHKVKELYCSNCLEHFGARPCPIVRGVPAYKKVDSKVLDKVRKL